MMQKIAIPMAVPQTLVTSWSIEPKQLEESSQHGVSWRMRADWNSTDFCWQVRPEEHDGTIDAQPIIYRDRHKVIKTMLEYEKTTDAYGEYIANNKDMTEPEKIVLSYAKTLGARTMELATDETHIIQWCAALLYHNDSALVPLLKSHLVV